MQRGQGSLEYLIIIAAVLAISAVVVLFLTGAFGGTQSSAKLNECKSAAAQCLSSHLLSPNDPCVICDTACTDNAGNDILTGQPSDRSDTLSGVYFCSQGKPEEVYPRGTAGGPGGTGGGPTVTSTATQEASTSTTAGKLRLEWSASSNVQLDTLEYTALKTGGAPFGTTCTISSSAVSCDTTLFIASTCSINNGGATASCYWEDIPNAFGEFTYTATVTDSDGKTATDSTVITVQDKTGSGSTSDTTDPVITGDSLSYIGGSLKQDITATDETSISKVEFTKNFFNTVSATCNVLGATSTVTCTGLETGMTSASCSVTVTSGKVRSVSCSAIRNIYSTGATYRVVITDEAGNVQTDTGSKPPDITAPVISEDSVTPSSFSAGQTGTRKVTATDSGGISKVDFYSGVSQSSQNWFGACTISGTTASCPILPASASCTVSTGATSVTCTYTFSPGSGTYYYHAEVTDSFDNKKIGSGGSFTVT